MPQVNMQESYNFPHQNHKQNTTKVMGNLPQCLYKSSQSSYREYQTQPENLSLLNLTSDHLGYGLLESSRQQKNPTINCSCLYSHENERKIHRAQRTHWACSHRWRVPLRYIKELNLLWCWYYANAQLVAQSSTDRGSTKTLSLFGRSSVYRILNQQGTLQPPGQLPLKQSV